MTLKERYQKEIAPALAKEFGIGNVYAVPKVSAITVSIGASQGKDAKFLDDAENTLRRITGQRPVVCNARKSVAAFKMSRAASTHWAGLDSEGRPCPTTGSGSDGSTRWRLARYRAVSAASTNSGPDAPSAGQ